MRIRGVFGESGQSMFLIRSLGIGQRGQNRVDCDTIDVRSYFPLSLMVTDSFSMQVVLRPRLYPYGKVFQGVKL
jgi:hypothetical protein